MSGKKKSQIKEITDYQQVHEAFTLLESEQLGALVTLGDLARQEAFRVLIVKHGGIDKIAPFLFSHHENSANEGTDILCKTLRVLTNLSYENNEVAQKIMQFKAEVVSRIVSLIAEEHTPELQRNAVALTANMVHADDGVREAFVSNGALELLVKILRENVDHDDDPMLLLSHSLRALENIGKLAIARTKLAVDLDVVALLLKVIKLNCSLEVKSTALRILGLFAFTGESLKALEKKKNVVVSTVAISLERIVAWKPDEPEEFEDRENYIIEILDTLNAFVLRSESLTEELFQAKIHCQLIQFIGFGEEKIRLCTLDVLANLADKQSYGKLLVDSGLLDKIYVLGITHIEREQNQASLAPPAAVQEAQQQTQEVNKYLRDIIKIIGCLGLQDSCLGAIASNKGLFTQLIMPLINYNKDNYIQRNACIALGNIARTDDNCREIESCGFIDTLLSILQQQDDVKVTPISTQLNLGESNLKVSAAFALNNLCKAPQDVKMAIVNSSVLPVLLEMLKPTQPESLQFYGMECVSNLCNENELATNMFLNKTIEPLLDMASRFEERNNVLFSLVKALSNMARTSDSNKRTVVSRLRKEGSQKLQSIREKIASLANSPNLKPATIKALENALQLLKECEEN